MATIVLKFANQGWHVRWNTPDKEEFAEIKEAFKDTLSLRDRYWDSEAFNKKGGWWVAYGALHQVSHLFTNYQEARDEQEQPYWQQFKQQQKEAREHFIIEEMARRQHEQKEAHQQQKRQQKKDTKQERQRAAKQERQKAEQQREAKSREEVRLPKTVNEAFALLHLKAPTTASEIKRAYHIQAMRCHPDHGGSHAAMISINAAYEIALAAC
jgi:hypothetical protein